MTIVIKRSGGFAGIELALGFLDSKLLTKQKADRARACVAQLSKLVAKKDAPASADHFQYEVTVRGDDGTKKSMTVIDTGDPQDPAVKIVMDLISFAG